jgi:hypothetical protein
MGPLRAGIVLVSVSVAAGGCGSQTVDSVSSRADHFYAAIKAEDAASACDDLAPEAREALEQQEGMACDEAILDQNLPDAVQHGTPTVYGSMAQVAYHDETVFLSRYDGRWLVTAVGCPPVSDDRPHECTIKVD